MPRAAALMMGRSPIIRRILFNKSNDRGCGAAPNTLNPFEFTTAILGLRPNILLTIIGAQHLLLTVIWEQSSHIICKAKGCFAAQKALHDFHFEMNNSYTGGAYGPSVDVNPIGKTKCSLSCILKEACFMGPLAP